MKIVINFTLQEVVVRQFCITGSSGLIGNGVFKSWRKGGFHKSYKKIFETIKV